MQASCSTTKVNRGTCTNEDLSSPENPCEIHDSASFLSEILNECSQNNNNNQNIDSDDNNAHENSIESRQSSLIGLYEIKTLIGENEKSPSKIEFKLHKKIKKNSQIENCTCHLNEEQNGQIHRKVTFHENSSENIENVFSQENLIKKTKSFAKQPCESSSFLRRLKNHFIKMSQTNKVEITPPPKFDVPPLIEIDQTNYMNPIHSPKRQNKKVLGEQIDFYYFDHGHASYFRTTDLHPTAVSEMLAQQTTYYATKFWSEVFGALHIGVTFFVCFFLQTYRFILYSFFRTALVAFLQITSDYFLKPMITVVFNGFLQPPLILIYNILSSIRDLLEPIAEIFDMFLKPFGNLLKNFRLITFKTGTDTNGSKLNDKSEKIKLDESLV